MKYPVGNGSREDFEKQFYVALGFGEKQPYGFHEGADINLKTGGDSDLGVAINAIADWELKYYHIKSHIESGFGTHLVYEVISPWGKRWIHIAHCQNPIDPVKKSKGIAGEKIAEIDKTGRPRLVLPAHLHLSVFKVDPTALPGTIDAIAKTEKQLNDWWEDPITFFHKWNDNKDDTMNIKQLIIDLRLGLLGDGPGDGELEYDMLHWENPKAFIERITGDAKFYKRYIQPQLDGQRQRLESDCNSALQSQSMEWQTRFDSAKREYEENLNKKIEDMDVVALLSLALKKLVGR